MKLIDARRDHYRKLAHEQGYRSRSAHCIPFLTWHNSSIELIQEQKESPVVGPTALI